MAGAREVLVVANRTAGGAKLAAHLSELIAQDPATKFYVLVPAAQSMTSWAATATPEMGTFPVDWVDLEAELRRGAQERLDQLVAWLRSAGATADGEVGSVAPLVAIDEVLKTRQCTEIVISSLPAGLSRWIRSDLSQRTRRRFGLPTATVQSDGDDVLPVSPAPPVMAEPAGEVAPVKLLLVGIDPRVRTSLAAASTSTTLTEAASAAGMSAPTTDVVVIDFDRLQSDRWDALAKVVGTFDCKRVAVAVLTSEPNRTDWQRAHDAGAWAYLSKPAADAELVWLLDTVLHEYRTLGTLRDLPR
jgi:CheY-like chemotaxis protein